MYFESPKLEIWFFIITHSGQDFEGTRGVKFNYLEWRKK